MLRAKEVVLLTAEERQELERSAHLRGDAGVPAVRARIVLLAAEGLGSKAIGARLGVAQATVRVWRRRFLQSGLEGLRDRRRPGRPREVGDELVGAVVLATIEAYLEGAAACSTRSIGAKLGVSQSSVSRIWRSYGLAPPHIGPTLEGTAELVGLHISPHARAAAFVAGHSGAAKTDARANGGCDAEGRAPVSPRVLEALQAAAREQHEETQSFADFLNAVDREVKAQTWIDVVIDGASLLKAPSARAAWLRRERFRWHLSPSYATWLARVGDWTRDRPETKAPREIPPSPVVTLVARIRHTSLSWVRSGEKREGELDGPSGGLAKRVAFHPLMR